MKLQFNDNNLRVVAQLIAEHNIHFLNQYKYIYNKIREDLIANAKEQREIATMGYSLKYDDGPDGVIYGGVDFDCSLLYPVYDFDSIDL